MNKGVGLLSFLVSLKIILTHNKILDIWGHTKILAFAIGEIGHIQMTDGPHCERGCPLA